MAWRPIAVPALPEHVPQMEAPGADIAWFELEESGRPLERQLAQVVGNGGAPPFVLAVYTLARPVLDDELVHDARWPTLPELWAICDELLLKGALVTLPAYIVGQMPPGGAESILVVTQAGALAGTPAGTRWELAGLAPAAGKPLGLIQ